MNRMFRALDVLLGLGLTAALAMCVLTAWPGMAQAAEATAEHRPVTGFTGLAVSGNFDVRIRQDSRDSVDVRAEATLLPQIETAIEGDKVLQVRWKRYSSVPASSRPVIEISAAHLESLASSGDSHVKADGLTAPRLTVHVSGAGDVALNGLSSEQLILGIAGSGDVRATGQSTRLQVKIAGSGNARTEGLKADEVRISIAGSGDAAVQAARSLDVSIAGSGDVSYQGAATVTSSIVGSGTVRKR